MQTVSRITQTSSERTIQVVFALVAIVAFFALGLAEAVAAANSPWTGGRAFAPAIGHVDTASGDVVATRADGARALLQAGDPVFLGDELETASGATVGLIFIDGSTFALDEDGRMVLDTLIFDPDALTGGSVFTVLEGVFSFVSGEIAKTGPEAMMVRTPVLTIGIRGTQVAGRAGPEGAANVVTLVAGADGHVGEISVTTNGGTQVLNVANQTVTATSTAAAPGQPAVATDADIQAQFGDVIAILPNGGNSGGGGGGNSGQNAGASSGSSNGNGNGNGGGNGGGAGAGGGIGGGGGGGGNGGGNGGPGGPG